MNVSIIKELIHSKVELTLAGDSTDWEQAAKDTAYLKEHIAHLKSEMTDNEIRIAEMRYGSWFRKYLQS